jgi:hypothetical protein
MPPPALSPRIPIRRLLVSPAQEENSHEQAAGEGLDGSGRRVADFPAETPAALPAGGALYARTRPEMAREARASFAAQLTVTEGLEGSEAIQRAWLWIVSPRLRYPRTAHHARSNSQLAGWTLDCSRHASPESNSRDCGHRLGSASRRLVRTSEACVRTNLIGSHTRDHNAFSKSYAHLALHLRNGK